MPQKTAPIVLLAIVLCLAGVVPAEASDDDDARRTPANGPIAFGRFDPAIGDLSLWVANSDGSNQRRLTEGPANFSDWSPDGTRIAFDFADDSGVHIATMDPDGQRRRSITTEPGVQEVPKWSPDGRWIAYDAFPFGQATFSVAIWVMRADGSQPRQLTRDAIDVEPVFSPDGSQLAFGRIVGDSPEGQLEAIYVINTDGTGLREVVPARPGLEHPDWSPNGRWITFDIGGENRLAEDPGAILAVRPSGRGLHVLQAPTERLSFFKGMWSPDGRHMLAGCYDTHEQIDRICSISNRGQVRVIIGGPTRVNYPSWGPVPSSQE